LVSLGADTRNAATKADTRVGDKESEPFQFIFNGFLKVEFPGRDGDPNAGLVGIGCDRSTGVKSEMSDKQRPILVSP